MEFRLINPNRLGYSWLTALTIDILIDQAPLIGVGLVTRSITITFPWEEGRRDIEQCFHDLVETDMEVQFDDSRPMDIFRSTRLSSFEITGYEGMLTAKAIWIYRMSDNEINGTIFNKPKLVEEKIPWQIYGF